MPQYLLWRWCSSIPIEAWQMKFDPCTQASKGTNIFWNVKCRSNLMLVKLPRVLCSNSSLSAPYHTFFGIPKYPLSSHLVLVSFSLLSLVDHIVSYCHCQFPWIFSAPQDKWIFLCFHHPLWTRGRIHHLKFFSQLSRSGWPFFIL